jgi:hypothetical protein
VSIPTVSGDPGLWEQCFQGAKYLARLLEGMGMQAKLAMAEKTVHPCVLARLEVSPTLPTLVFYGHYDVQPAQELVRCSALYCIFDLSMIARMSCRNTTKHSYARGRQSRDMKFHAFKKYIIGYHAMNGEDWACLCAWFWQIQLLSRCVYAATIERVWRFHARPQSDQQGLCIPLLQ